MWFPTDKSTANVQRLVVKLLQTNPWLRQEVFSKSSANRRQVKSKSVWCRFTLNNNWKNITTYIFSQVNIDICSCIHIDRLTDRSLTALMFPSATFSFFTCKRTACHRNEGNKLNFSWVNGHIHLTTIRYTSTHHNIRTLRVSLVDTNATRQVNNSD